MTISRALTYRTRFRLRYSSFFSLSLKNAKYMAVWTQAGPGQTARGRRQRRSCQAASPRENKRSTLSLSLRVSLVKHALVWREKNDQNLRSCTSLKGSKSLRRRPTNDREPRSTKKRKQRERQRRSRRALGRARAGQRRTIFACASFLKLESISRGLSTFLRLSDLAKMESALKSHGASAPFQLSIVTQLSRLGLNHFLQKENRKDEKSVGNRSSSSARAARSRSSATTPETDSDSRNEEELVAQSNTILRQAPRSAPERREARSLSSARQCGAGGSCTNYPIH